MSENKKPENTDENDGITINLKECGLTEFTKRPVPSEKQVEEFEECVDEMAGADDAGTAFAPDNFDSGDGEVNGVSDEEIEDSLEQIYQDDKGNRVDVKRMQILKKRGIIFWFFSFIFIVSAIGILGYAGYKFYINSGTDTTTIDFYVESKSEITAGEEFFYTIHCKNTSGMDLLLPRVEVIFPKNFVMLESEPKNQSDNKGIWDLPSLPSHSENIIKIKGVMIAPEGTTGSLFANISYTPQNFSSEFKKDASAMTLVKDIGMDISVDYIATALLKEKGEINLNFRAKEDNFIKSFVVGVEGPDNFELRDRDVKTEDKTIALFEKQSDRKWLIKEVPAEEKTLPIDFIFLNKTDDTATVTVYFEKEAAVNGEKLRFYEKTLNFEVMKSDLNIALIINGSREDQGINFGDTLNYSIVYNNKGETDMKDVIIMAVLNGSFLDWTTLDEKNGAQEKGNSLTWTKNEMPVLEFVGKHQEGTIDFSIKALDIAKVDPGQNYEIKSYAQFFVGATANGTSTNTDNKSNTITNKINSDLKLVEQVRYFNEDNITVGNGPLPLKVGEKTSFKVYWSLTNNLHELTDASVEVSLPAYVAYDEKSRTNVGFVSYDSANHKVVWNVGRLPLTVFRADAEFNIAVTPTADDVNKIVVLKPGSKVSAMDAETKNKIDKITDVKTSKLEDDEISQKTNDGVVRQ